MEVATGAGLAVAADLHVPEECLAQLDGGAPILDELGKQFVVQSNQIVAQRWG